MLVVETGRTLLRRLIGIKMSVDNATFSVDIGGNNRLLQFHKTDVIVFFLLLFQLDLA
jgi:hypothetical protein